jgi:hypothetical protein
VGHDPTLPGFVLGHHGGQWAYPQSSKQLMVLSRNGGLDFVPKRF